jgi:hypothetical protein
MPFPSLAWKGCQTTVCANLTGAQADDCGWRIDSRSAYGQCAFATVARKYWESRLFRILLGTLQAVRGSVDRLLHNLPIQNYPFKIEICKLFDWLNCSVMIGDNRPSQITVGWSGSDFWVWQGTGLENQYPTVECLFLHFITVRSSSCSIRTNKEDSQLLR